MNHLTLILGLTPVTCVAFLIVRWFVVGTMEHGWEVFHRPCDTGACSVVGLHVVQFLASLGLAVLFCATMVLGIQEARKAWGRIRS